MIELRWIEVHWTRLKDPEDPPDHYIPLYDKIDGQVWRYKVLQYRTLKTRIDATGALNVLPNPEYTEWQDVPIGGE